MTAKVTTTAKAATPATPAAAKSTTAKTATASKVSTKAGATTSSKTSATSTKTTTTKAATTAKSLAKAGDYLPVCAYEALAMSLRLAGAQVHDDDVAELWWRGGAGVEGAAVGDAIADAVRFGLAGYRPRWFEIQRDLEVGKRRDALPLNVGPLALDGVGVADLGSRDALKPVAGEFVGHALILGIDRPGPHAVLATRDGWWSWGELYDPWAAHVDEAWAVSWEADTATGDIYRGDAVHGARTGLARVFPRGRCDQVSAGAAA